MLKQEIEKSIQWILKEIFLFIASYILGVLFYYTVEYLLFIGTLGRIKPTPNRFKKYRPAVRVLFMLLYCAVGFSFWVFTIGWTARILPKYF